MDLIYFVAMFMHWSTLHSYEDEQTIVIYNSMNEISQIYYEQISHV